MTLDEFLKHVYHTRKFVVIPDLNRGKINKEDFLKKNGRLDNEALTAHLTKLYHRKYSKK